MNRALRSADDLLSAGLISGAEADALGAVLARYAVSVTPDMAELIDPQDPDDPIGRQFVPRVAEAVATPEERADPIGDAAHAPVTGIVHRYPDRVLLKPLHVCPVYCRFCFRREMVGPDGLGTLTDAELDAALAYIAQDPRIWEVVLTGGDPFALSPRRLGVIAERLAAIAHVRVMRVHTRVPVVKPDLVSDALVRALKRFGRAVFVAVHANHPREFTAAASAACARLVDAGIPLVGQSVLLRGVNDEAATLEALMRTLVENRIKPYYLHHGDLAPGTAHLRTDVAEGQALMRALRGRLSGLAQPTYVLDIPGGHGKVPIGPGYLRDTPDGVRVTDPGGQDHAYPPKA
ncbi:lysine 2,3-aminomutase [Methylobacterium sp. PvP062]|jgi:lysine 2,3-aminomutase|uniref:Lysine 2,3-aminomutase YodO family protein n=2 Tax=Methylobacterium radiotolerans TaxID=31998 RepID=B1M2B3_METRJ|nr:MULTISPECIES: lysine-2,3-aminomutase-like protein [Methylobacterium]MCX7332196.1 lysine-2,3-aminomutase-like protein [Hyphomicrobiales bacterium]GAN48442.1 probabable KamA [Methylobacterium sp. ME121]ACB24724.1 lysine 2,3-aminomutase YodO family protein [Methylobacterium radiotolerans JCM 2831]KTS10968.1 lysine 2,3-aminomutase [Methylobacterium radiotolerans]KTS48902.1 lysine 2,3-aminomutase [Methylobacterium radiotolerans]